VSPTFAATVADLVHVLDAEIIAEPRGLSVPIGRTVVLDEADFDAGGAGVPRDCVILLMGSDDAALPHHARQQLRDTRLAAIVVRGPLSADTADVALAASAAMLRIPDSTSWNEVLSRLRGLSSAEGEQERGFGTGAMDLFEIADAAAALAGGPVTIEDGLHQILAYSADQSNADSLRITTLLRRRTPAVVIDRMRRDGTWQRIRNSREPQFLEGIEPGATPRLVVAVRSEREILGSMWAALPVDGEQPSAKSLIGFARCADRVATHILQFEGAVGRVRKVEVEHLARLLHGGNDSSHADAPRVRANGVHTVIAVAFELSPDRRTHAKSRIVHALDRARLTVDAGLIVGDLNDLLYIVVTAPDERSPILSVVVGLIGEAPGVYIGVSTRAHNASELPQSRVHAERALSVARHRRTSGCAAYFDDVWPSAALLRLATSPMASEITSWGPAQRLGEIDRANNTEYVRTLREFLLAGCDSRLAASRLNVHVNTVRYRMSKLKEDAGLDLDDPLARLVLTLQLTLQQIRDA